MNVLGNIHIGMETPSNMGSVLQRLAVLGYAPSTPRRDGHSDTCELTPCTAVTSTGWLAISLYLIHVPA